MYFQRLTDTIYIMVTSLKFVLHLVLAVIVFHKLGSRSSDFCSISKSGTRTQDFCPVFNLCNDLFHYEVFGKDDLNSNQFPESDTWLCLQTGQFLTKFQVKFKFKKMCTSLQITDCREKVKKWLTVCAFIMSIYRHASKIYKNNQ